MTMKNKYCYGTHISERKFREILKYFCADETASKTSKYTRLNRNTVNRMYGLLRQRIAEMSIKNVPALGAFEVDERYFGARRIRGKRGRGAAGKTPVFGEVARSMYISLKIAQKSN